MSQYNEYEVDFMQQKTALENIITVFKRVSPNDSRIASIEQMVADITLPTRDIQLKVPDAVSDLCVQLQFLGNALHGIRMTPEISLETALAVGKLSAGCEFIDVMFSTPIGKEDALSVLDYLCTTFIVPSAAGSKFPEGTADALSAYGHVMTVNDDQTVTFKTKGGIDLVSLPYTPTAQPH